MSRHKVSSRRGEKVVKRGLRNHETKDTGSHSNITCLMLDIAFTRRGLSDSLQLLDVSVYEHSVARNLLELVDIT